MTKINIHNVRLGHATNSSSSHSIVIVPKELIPKDDGYICHSDDEDYGWENFTLSNPDTKKQYLVSQLANNLEESVGPQKASELIKEWFDVEFSVGKNDWSDSEVLKSPGIDHQSVITFPIVTEKFAKDFVTGLSENSQVVIYGGNDNQEEIKKPKGSHEFSEIEQFRDISVRSNIRIREDGKYYIMYSPDSGNKIRLSFDQVHLDNPAEGYVKSSTPELVDVKITNRCSYGCSFCYQGSTKAGKHASIEDIEATFKQLAELGVFEVAIGGGEPTEHPQFKEILELAVKYNITPNFTTFSVAWLKDEKLLDVIQTYVGGIGVSVHTEADLAKVKKIKKVLSKAFYNGMLVISQHVVGTTSIDETCRIINSVRNNNDHLLLLGYKDVGFGADYEKYDDDDFAIALKMILDQENTNYWFTLSVDTTIIQNYPNLPKLLNVDPVLYTKEEGKFSCYVDIVEDKIGPSSYCNQTDMIDMPNTSDEFKEIYSKW